MVSEYKLVILLSFRVEFTTVEAFKKSLPTAEEVTWTKDFCYSKPEFSVTQTMTAYPLQQITLMKSGRAGSTILYYCEKLILYEFIRFKQCY